MTSKDTDAKKQESYRHIDKATARQRERTTTIQNDDNQSVSQALRQTDRQPDRQSVGPTDRQIDSLQPRSQIHINHRTESGNRCTDGEANSTAIYHYECVRIHDSAFSESAHWRSTLKNLLMANEHSS